MPDRARILVVDDDPLVRKSCDRVLGSSHLVKTVEDGETAIEALRSGAFDLALVDLKLPGLSGFDLLERAPALFPDVPVIIITGYSTMQNAAEAIRGGAFDFIEKPFTPAVLEAVVEKALRQRKLLKEYVRLKSALDDSFRIRKIVGESPTMKAVAERMEQVARTDSTVLVAGEPGTGKELTARAIHVMSSRRNGSFVALDLASIPPDRIASEMFGGMGSPAGDVPLPPGGLISQAEGGTLFLDEIGRMPPEAQALLLAALDAGERRPPFASLARKTGRRTIAATSDDLADRARQGAFRRDLLYRLDVFRIELPPLRERRGDIPLLARHFLAHYAAQMHREVEDLTPEALAALSEYSWPGNVRELENVVERLVILAGRRKVADQSHVREVLGQAAPPVRTPSTLEEFNALKKRLKDEAIQEIEKNFLMEALKRNDFNVTRAAEQTGMQRTNFQMLLKKHGLRMRDMDRD